MLQIRVQLAAEGCPLFGDSLYASHTATADLPVSYPPAWVDDFQLAVQGHLLRLLGPIRYSLPVFEYTSASPALFIASQDYITLCLVYASSFGMLI